MIVPINKNTTFTTMTQRENKSAAIQSTYPNQMFRTAVFLVISLSKSCSCDKEIVTYYFVT